MLRWFKFKINNIKVWKYCNIYKTAKIGGNVSIGSFTEIGDGVEIGEGTRIGAGCFIPAGVKIGRNVFVGPKVCFSNDMYPPGEREGWQETLIEDEVSIGANVSIRPGIHMYPGALIGMGAVVTKDVQPWEIWAGVPARYIRDRDLKGDEMTSPIRLLKGSYGT